MADSDDVQALEKISTEVDESQIKLILSTQCIKAQAFLVNKLKKQSERRKETCGFLSSANMKLEAEIKQAEHEIKSLLIAHETIKMANVELKKEWLLAKEQKLDISERIQSGEKKYEELWLESKNRYESIPYIQKFLKAKDKARTLKEHVQILENQTEMLIQDIEIQKDVCLNSDKKRIIEVAKFITNEMPNCIQLINEKTIQVNDLMKNIEDITREKEVNVNIATNMKELDKQEDVANVDTVSDDDEDNFIMPKLVLENIDLNEVNVKLDQMKDIEIMHTTPEKREHSVISYSKIHPNKSYRNENVNDYISPFFNKTGIDEEHFTQNYSKKKLINILDDIKVSHDDAYNMVSKVNIDKLQPVDEIGAEVTKGDKTLISEDIEEIDMTATYTESILIPPSQFLDINLGQQKVIIENLPTSQENVNVSQSKISQESEIKKKVSFDLANTLEIYEMLESGDNNESIPKETMNASIDVVSTVYDASYTKMREMIIKKHNLDLSPQFIYTKKTILEKKNEDKIVTSKFFQIIEETKNKTNEQTPTESQLPGEKDNNEMEVDELEQIPNENIDKQTNDNPDKDQTIEMDIDHMVVSSPKEQKTDLQKSNEAIGGFLFRHGPQALSESLNVSMSTMGCEDSNVDFPHCLDSSLLLSPKADMPITMSSDQPEVLSQEVPNFLSGLRKTGLSFFGRMPSSDSKPDSSAQNQGSFNFNFGGEEKKNRGGLFSMFQ